MQDQVQSLRARLEVELPSHAVILVTSAEQNDGKSVTAFGLATSFSSAGYRSVLIDANPLRHTPQLGHLPAMGNADVTRIDAANAYYDADNHVYAIRLVEKAEASLMSLRHIRALTDQCRTAYDYTIIDGSDFFSTGLPSLLAKCVDGVLISLRHGRKPSDCDSLLVQTVEETGARVLGVVLVEAASRKALAVRSKERSPERPLLPTPGMTSPGRAL